MAAQDPVDTAIATPGAAAEGVSDAPDAPHPRRRTGLVIGLVVAILLACCCGVAGIGAVLCIRTDSDTASSPDIDLSSPSLAPEDRMAAWSGWYPEPEDPLDPTPASAHALVLEGLGVVAPDFTLAESVWWPGYYDEDEDWYYSDDYYVRAFHPSSDRVSAAVELAVQSDDMIAEGIALEPEIGTDIITRIEAGSRQLLYSPQWGDGFTVADDQIDLWKRIGDDWPDAVVVEGYADADDDFWVTITKWPLYAVKTDFPVVFARYRRSESAWELIDWKYIDAGTPPIETTTA